MLILSFVFFLLFSLYFLDEELAILQTQFYELKRYLIYKKDKEKSQVRYILLISMILINLCLFIYYKLKFLIVLFPFILLLMFYQNHHKRIVKLKYTSRIKRIIMIYLIITIILGQLFIYLSKLHSYIFLFSFEFLIMIIFKLFVSLVILIDKPIEKLITFKYQSKAVRKLKRVKPILIGITGSYGKTSTKNYLYQLLSLKYRVCKTPKSFNTYLGIMKSINEEMDENCEVMIIELGADKVKGLDKILSILEFDYSIITSIGPQHLKTFKTIDNILKEKSKIFAKTKKCIFLNYNCEYLRTLDLSRYCKSLTYSYYSDSDIYIDDIKTINNQTIFTLNTPNSKLNMATNILGKHQTENLLGSIVIAQYLGISIDKIANKIKYLINESHRMEIKQIGNIKIIDDSYNSNIKGFKCALDVLSVQEGYRVLITPGVIELGNEWERANRELGRYANGKVDFIVLVGKSVTRPLYLGLVTNGFNEENILVVDSFKEGKEYIESIKKEIVLLIENDLPDYYLK